MVAMMMLMGLLLLLLPPLLLLLLLLRRHRVPSSSSACLARVVVAALFVLNSFGRNENRFRLCCVCVWSGRTTYGGLGLFAWSIFLFQGAPS